MPGQCAPSERRVCQADVQDQHAGVVRHGRHLIGGGWTAGEVWSQRELYAGWGKGALITAAFQARSRAVQDARSRARLGVADRNT